MENYKDFATKKTRLNKRDYSADFRLVDSDDFFGFSETTKTTWYEKIGYTIMTLAVGYYIYQGVMFIITNGLTLY